MIAVVILILAIIIGAWRQQNQLIEKNHPYQVAGLWRNSVVKTSTWIAVALFSIASAYLFSKYIQVNVGDFIGKFSFGVILFLRWLASMAIGAYFLSKHYDIEKLK